MKLWPSNRSPGMAINKEPGITCRESMVASVITALASRRVLVKASTASARVSIFLSDQLSAKDLLGMSNLIANIIRRDIQQQDGFLCHLCKDWCGGFGTPDGSRGFF